MQATVSELRPERASVQSPSHASLFLLPFSVSFLCVPRACVCLCLCFCGVGGKPPKLEIVKRHACGKSKGAVGGAELCALQVQTQKRGVEGMMWSGGDRVRALAGWQRTGVISCH